MTVKILFVNVIKPKAPEKKSKFCVPPLGLGYLTSSLRQHFGENAFSFKIIEENIEEELMKFKPDVVGLTSVSQNYGRAVSCAKFIKTQEDIPLCIGGSHISLMPDSLSHNIDVGVIGEGERTIVELFELFEKEGDFDKQKLDVISGLVYRNNNGKLCVTKPRELIRPLDSIPFPDRDLFQIEDRADMFTSRGCPYNCIFCCSTRFWKSARFHSAEYVLREVNELVEKYHVKHILFYDDLFIANKARLKNITKLIREEGLQEKVSFHCACRANLVSDEIIKLLKSMNVKSITMGLESGCSNSLRYLKGPTVTVEDNRNAVELAKKYGFEVHGDFIIGAPYETGDEIMETFEFIRKSKIDLFGFIY